MRKTKPTAAIVGSDGQDGRLLTAWLRDLGYRIVGINRSAVNIADLESVKNLISTEQPCEVYFLAAHHHSSEDICADEGDLFLKSITTNTIAVVCFLEAIATQSPKSRFFYSSSCLVFPPADEEMQTENTPLRPENPYAISKATGMEICRYYRERRGVFASVGILYNHESPLRNSSFVSRKIAASAVRIAKDGFGELTLGNIDAKVDWGYAPDYVKAMHLILQSGDPSTEYVIATGEGHTVREFAEIAFRLVGLDYRNYLSARPQKLSRQNSTRIGDSSRLRSRTGWKPSVTFEQLVGLIVDAEKNNEHSSHAAQYTLPST